MLKVKEVSELLNIPISTLHYYESMGLVHPSRTSSCYRSYSEKDIRNLKFAILMKTFGFSIQEMKEVLDRYQESETNPEVIHDARLFFSKKIQQLEAKIKQEQMFLDILKRLPLFGDHNIEQKRAETNKMMDRLFQERDLHFEVGTEVVSSENQK